VPSVPGAYIAGQVVAGIVDGTVIEGAHFIAYGQQGEILVYSGVPASGNLIASISAMTGTDDYGNSYEAGVVTYNAATGSEPGVTVQMQSDNILFIDPLSADPQTFISGIGALHVVTTGQVPITFVNSSADDTNGTHSALWLSGTQLGGGTAPTVSAFAATSTGTIQTGTGFLFNIVGTLVFGQPGGGLPVASGPTMQLASGNLTVTSAADSNIYDIQALHVAVYPAQTISSTGFVNVTGADAAVAAAHYRWTCVVWYTTSAAAGNPQFQFTSPATTGNLSLTGSWVTTATAATAIARATNTSLTLGQGAALSLGSGAVATFEGDATFSAAGTLQLQAETSASADTYTIQTVFLDLYPVN
jgi:hypothetical protein